ncbi:VanZ family protein [Rhizobium sp. CSW-27]|uniref:VanZ family protein n=1 Tax=Rhizobium sp. CSW-27 TaxID=2839985 RepID=UPI001C029836|nr:VanZ family protein [Rhizobium sp. CSW-27]MBT9370089.1 VanZ family protein [Rhizobium sp. CSW-27]
MMSSRTFRMLAWLSLAAIIFVTISPIGLRPHDPLPVNLDRALAFAVMGFLFIMAYPKRPLLLIVVLLASAGLIEMLQFLAPTRHAHLADAVIKAMGAGAGALLAWTWQSVHLKRRQVRVRRR